MKPFFLAGDFETYYDSKTFTLKKMGNEEYILDPRFEIHGCAFSVNGAPSKWYDLPALKVFLAGLPWGRVVFASHNALFDAAILCWRLGHTAVGYIDTLSLAHIFVRPHYGSSSLDSCAKFHGWPVKTEALKEVNGKRTHEIKAFPGLFEKLAAYCEQDCDECAWMVYKYYFELSGDEKVRMDWSVRNYIRGRLRLDLKLLEAAYAQVDAERQQLLLEAGIDEKTARSRPKFAAYLEGLGVEVEYKNGKNDAEIPAIAKNDPFVADMLASGRPEVVAAMRARLAMASTIELSRADRLIRMAKATGGKMLLPTVHHAAHTGRPGGTDKVNPYNFRKRSPKDPPGKIHVREGIVVPKGKVLLEVDASQIEARLMAWIARCGSLLEAFADPDRDVYCEVATTLFDYPVDAVMELERQCGKVTVLSGQYGVGWMKTMRRLQGDGIDCDEAMAKQFVYGYRKNYPEILSCGAEFIALLKECISGRKELEFKGCLLAPEGIQLPVGGSRWLHYPELKFGQRWGLEFYSHRYKSWQSLHAGYLNENLCQAMTNDHIGKVHVKYVDKVVLMVYDSLVLLVDEDEAETLASQVVVDMSTPSPWMVTLHEDMLQPPLAAKYKIKRSL